MAGRPDLKASDGLQSLATVSTVLMAQLPSGFNVANLSALKVWSDAAGFARSGGLVEDMRIAVVGGGPAGLFFAYLWKKRHPDADVRVIEQNPADVTWGFGVVFSERALDFLRADAPEIVDVIGQRMESWRNMTLDLKGQRVEIDGVGFSAIGRLALLQLLQDQARAVGVDLNFGELVQSVDELGDVDLIIGADGLNSAVRRSFEGDFKTSLYYGDNKFAWFGTARRFETLSQTFVETDRGYFTAHHYRYAPALSTFLIECDRPTWTRYGFATMTIEQSQKVCEDVFAATLEGHRLISNKSVWRSFPWLSNDRWHFRDMVLVGDALRTAHFSIGSGTRLALEDVIALVKALETENDVARGLAAYQAARRPIVETLVVAARRSADWYERFPAHMRLDPRDFAYSYITRSGRIDDERLREMSPAFMARYETARISKQLK
jgi:2-polyprenyl-6-methoxyphenol hydroxylase-like FAD-dependent oxidoreductase